ncbi:MAG TPA: insulinase family protein [Candidatus Baltobacteraceae bacterium]|nr:insulinase family protein [Candidatus Baltobacteraceae bacterium]
MIVRWISALLVAAFAVAAPLHFSSARPSSDSITGTLPQHGTYVVYRMQGAPVAVVALWYRAPSIGYGITPVPSLAHLAAQAVAASTPVTGKSLSTVVHENGGHLTISVYANSVSISALVPTDAASTIVAAMTRAYFSPVLDDKGLAIARSELAEEAIFTSFDPIQAAHNAVVGSLFSSGPQHYPALGSAKALSSIDQDTLRSFSERAFRAQNAVLVLTGDVDERLAASAVQGRIGSGGADLPISSPIAAEPTASSEPFDEAGGGQAWVGPKISDERSATALDFIADYLFRPQTGTLTKSISDLDSSAYVEGQFITLHDPGVFFVGYTSKNADGVSKEIDLALQTIQSPLAKTEFARARAAFAEHLLFDLQTPSEVADTFGWYTVEGNPTYAPGADGVRGRYFSAVNSLTPELVASVAKKYFGGKSSRITFEQGKSGKVISR